MNRRLFFGVFTITLTVAIISLAGYRLGIFQSSFVNLLASAGYQDSLLSANPVSSTTDEAAPTKTYTLSDVLQELQNQERLLAEQVLSIRSELEVSNLRSILARTIKRGDSGKDVLKLQEFLGKFSGSYSTSSVTGFYGPLTENSVMNFQVQEGLKKTGVADQVTREKIFELAVDFAGEEGTSTDFTPINLSYVPELQNSHDQVPANSSPKVTVDSLQNQVSQLSSSTSDIQANIADLQNQVSQLSLNLSTIQSGLSSTLPPTPPLAPVPSTTPTPSLPPTSSSSSSPPTSPTPPLAPVPSTTPTPSPLPTPTSSSSPSQTPVPVYISGASATNITRTSAVIAWMTNKTSTSEADYSKSSSIPYNQMSIVSNLSLTTSHSITILNLSSGTTYYYRVVSKDGTGSVATSTISSFTVLH